MTRFPMIFLFVFFGTVASAQDDALRVYVAKKIVTMDPGLPEATAVAAKDGRLLQGARAVI